MDKKNSTIIIVVAVVVGAVAFFGGIKYGQSPSALAKLSTAQKQTLAQSLRGSAATGGAAGSTRLRGAFQGGQGGFSSGQIISKDDKSITIQTQGTGSKIIFYSGSTTIGKTASGTPDDLQKGTQVLVSGTANPDGSINAQSINLNPAMRGGVGASPAQPAH